MSRLEELIAELCPDGVEYKRLGEVVQFLNGRAYKMPELLSEGKYKVLRVGNFFTSDKWYYSNLELDEDKYCYDGDLLYARVLRTGVTEVVDDARLDRHYDGTGKGKTAYGELAEICTPIILRNTIIGIIGLIAFTEEQQRILSDKNKN
ncbi:MAG: restriction endonuclease subunit S, partial [Methanocorpusculum sp.]|nr:restriction endonuclease subunit S [Methanocorpusculum sp.]